MLRQAQHERIPSHFTGLLPLTLSLSKGAFTFFNGLLGVCTPTASQSCAPFALSAALFGAWGRAGSLRRIMRNLPLAELGTGIPAWFGDNAPVRTAPAISSFLIVWM